MSSEHAQLGIDKAEEALRRVAVLEACFAAFDDWIAIRFEGDPTLRTLDERLVVARGGESPISDLEAADAWCREMHATVRYVAPEDGPYAVEVLAERSARSYRGRGSSLAEAVEDARIRHARIAAVGAE